MSSCKIDHSNGDVLKKLEEQKEFLPADIYTAVKVFLQANLAQETLNEIFHLLKKYDLAGKAEQDERNEVLRTIVKS